MLTYSCAQSWRIMMEAAAKKRRLMRKMWLQPWRRKWHSCKLLEASSRGASRSCRAEQTTSSSLKLTTLVNASADERWCGVFWPATISVFFLWPSESDKLVHHILTDLHTTKKKKSRVILRMLPVRSECWSESRLVSSDVRCVLSSPPHPGDWNV